MATIKNSGSDSAATPQAAVSSDTFVLDDSAVTDGNRLYNLSGPSGNLTDGYSGTFRTDYHGDVDYSGIRHFDITGTTAGDSIVTGDGSDIVNGNAGNDYLQVGQGADVVDGGADFDTLSVDLTDQTANVTIDLTKTGQQDSGGTKSIQNMESFGGTVTGSAKNDTFIENNNANATTFNTGAGNDLVQFAATVNVNQTLDMGSGTDTLVIDASGVTDSNSFSTLTSLSGSAAAGYSGAYRTGYHGDVNFSNVEKFDIYGTSSNDSIITGDGADIADGNAGSDYIQVGKGSNTVDGGADFDTLSIDLSGQAAGSTIDLTKTGQQDTGGTNSIQNMESFGGTVTGSAKNDTFIENNTANVTTFNTGAGNDLVQFTETANNNQTLDMGSGIDTLVIDASGVTDGNSFSTLTSLSGSAAAGYSGGYRTGYHADVNFSNVENFDIYGTSANDQIVTGDGNDIAKGNDGDDTIQVGAGNNTVDGGIGNNALGIDLSGQTTGVAIDLTKTGEQDTGGTNSIQNMQTFTGTVTGSAYGDTLIEANDTGAATFNTGAGNDLVKIVAGTNDTQTIDGGADNDTLVIDASSITDGNAFHTLTGLSGDATNGYSGGYRTDYHGDVNFSNVENFDLYGGSGNDQIVTGDGNDIAIGSAGNDTITVGAGANTVDGGADNDYLGIDLSGQTTGVAIDLTKAGEQDTGGTNSIQNMETFTGTVTGSAYGDTLIEANDTGAATFNTGAGNDLVKIVAGTNDTQTIDGGADNDTLVIDASSITDGNAFHTLTGLSGDATNGYSGGYRTDYHGDVNFSNVENFDLYGGSGNDQIVTGDGNDIASGGAGDDTISTAGGTDTVSGGTGTNSLDGGLGTDTLSYADAASGVTVDLSNTAAQSTGVSTDTIVNFENLTGSAYDDTLTGDGRANVIVGGAGADTMAGGGGDDSYYVTGSGDKVIENANAGTDTVFAAIDYTLTDNVENGTATGTGNINLTGNALANMLVGNSGDNVLNGGAGADTMRGGAGNDTYYVTSAGDVVIENAGEGTDTVRTSVDYTLADNVENGIATGTGNVGITGNALANTLTGNGGDNVLNGGIGADTMIGLGGNDTYYVTSSGDVVIEGANAGIDTIRTSVAYTLSDNVENGTATGTTNVNLTGNALANSLTGNSGNNILDGGAGADTMIGLGGNDTYYVDNVGDLVTEAADGGSDTVLASISYALTDNVEQLQLFGQNLTGTGNVLDNSIFGDATYASTLNGGDGADTLTGGAGNDVLNGGAGADTMKGAGGDDTYYVTSTGDKVIEGVNGGTDTVRTTITYTLADNVENGVATGTANINLTGNALANTLTGNSGNNVLNGGAGADTMAGLGGNDTYYVTSSGDSVTEGLNAGSDTVHASVSYVLGDNLENLILDGTSQLHGTGNALDNNITGNSANNVLAGGGGADTFMFKPNFGKDIVSDFTAGDATGHDVLAIDHTIFGSYAAAMAASTQNGNDVLITANAGETITLKNVTLGALTSSDFSFT